MSIERLYLSPPIESALRLAIQVLIPIIIVLGSVRIILVSAKSWVPYEYRLSSFPTDTYGFTKEDRIYWSAVDLDFLLNEEDISYFETYKLDDGTPMHNQRELAHMEDVKVVVNASNRVLQWGLVALVGLVVFGGWSQGSEFPILALKTGSLWSLIFVGVLILGVIFAFGFVFVGFHQIFFQAGTWTFKYSDTFIRLYPERFWRDVFIYVGGLTTLQAGALFGLTRIFLKRIG
jgi:integral membrane protein (TIGR01906 family)